MGQQDQQNHQSGSSIKVDILQDLNWLMQSQPLMLATSDVAIFRPQDIDEALTYLLTNPPSCISSYTHIYPAQPAYRLGKHFEDCVDRLFESSSANNIIARNIVIQTPERTIGE